MDGVIFEHQNFWMELHKAYGTYEQGKSLTRKYLRTDYAKLVEEVVEQLWKGKPAEPYFRMVNKAVYVDGVKETFKVLKEKGMITALITSGPSHLAERAQRDLEIDYVFSNMLVIRDNVVTGEFKWPLGHGDKEKIEIVSQLVAQLCIRFSEVAYVGDYENDVGVCKKVGMSIAFNSDAGELRKVCKVVIDKPDLRLILSHVT